MLVCAYYLYLSAVAYKQMQDQQPANYKGLTKLSDPETSLVPLVTAVSFYVARRLFWPHLTPLVTPYTKD